MRKKLWSTLPSTRWLIIVAGLVFALTLAIPAVGASPLKLAKRALTTAQNALTTANQAKTTANQANTTANQALGKANGISQVAYARMDNPCSTSSTCTIDHASGISQIRQTSTGGLYCVTAPGKSPNTNAWVASVDDGDTGANVSDAQAAPNSNGAACNTGEFEVQTTRSGGTNATNVAFFVEIP